MRSYNADEGGFRSVGEGPSSRERGAGGRERDGRRRSTAKLDVPSPFTHAIDVSTGANSPGNLRQSPR
jgi:hypothetical protein